MNGQYRLTAPTLAIFSIDGQHESTIVPTGTILDLFGKTFNGSRLMDVFCDGRTVMMFTDDLKAKTVPA